jgi:hypothetical protein
MASQSNSNPLVDLEPTRVLVHELAHLILPINEEVENVWRITNRVYDRYAAEIEARLYPRMPLEVAGPAFGPEASCPAL